MRPDNEFFGVLPINKPRGMTSHDAVAIVRRLARQRSVGHTGTLDPLADGLLVLCLGRATKVSQYLLGLSKTYEATVCLGMSSRTFDAEGIDETTPTCDIPEFSEADIDRALQAFVGETEQRVPAFSAVSVDGRRLYEAARRGEDVVPPVRKVQIDNMTLLAYSKPSIRFAVTCGKGTYIRSIADDLGAVLGCGGYLSALTRTSIGDIALDSAHTIETLQTLAQNDRFREAILPIEQVLPFGAMLVTDSLAGRVLHGPDIGWEDIVQFEGQFHSGEPVMLKSKNGKVLAVGNACVGSDETIGDGHEAPLFRYARVLG